MAAHVGRIFSGQTKLPWNLDFSAHIICSQAHAYGVQPLVVCINVRRCADNGRHFCAVSRDASAEVSPSSLLFQMC